MINKRVMKIVEVLLNQETYITIDRISEQLSVSNKTIRNDLQLVDEWLKGNQLQLVKKTGIGVRSSQPEAAHPGKCTQTKQIRCRALTGSPQDLHRHAAGRL